MAIAHKSRAFLDDPVQISTDKRPQNKTAKGKRVLDSLLALLVVASIVVYSQREAVTTWLFPEPQQANRAVDLSIVSLDDVLLNRALMMSVAQSPQLSLRGEETLFEVDADRLSGASARMSLQDIYQLLTQSRVPVVSDVRIVEVVDRAERERTVNAILFEAGELFKQDKLTTPRIDNAFAKYEDVLALEPGNARALAGINNIMDRYRFFIDSVIAKREKWKVPTLVEGLVSVGRKYTDTTTIIEQYRQYLSDDNVISLLPQEPTSAGFTTTYALNSGEVLRADDAIAGLAVDLIHKQNHSSANSVLNEFLSVAPIKNRSFDVLMQLYLLQGEAHKAEELIYQVDGFGSSEMAEKSAHIFTARGDFTGALELLQTHQPESVDKNQSYFYLMAGLLYKSGQAEAAAAWYKKLLAADMNNSHYWFGLAVMLENNNYDHASLAYRVSHRLAAENSLVNRYFEQNSLAL